MKALDLLAGREAVKFCNSYSRIPDLIALSDDMAAADWLVLLGEEWSGCDNIGEHIAWDADDGEPSLWDTHFADLWDCPELRQHLMNEAERAAFAKLPDEFEIWRGCYAINRDGLSWTLDRNVAERFPLLNRYRRDGEQALLVKARIRKSECIALKLDRGEHEIVALRTRCPLTGRRVGPRIVSVSHIVV